MREWRTSTMTLCAVWAGSLAWAATRAPEPSPEPGIYVEQGPAGASVEARVEKLPPAKPTRTGMKDIAKSMVKGALSGGLLGGGPKMVLVFSGARSPARLSEQPMFQFHFDPKAAAAPSPSGPMDMASLQAMMEQQQGTGSDMPPGMQKPQQFALVRLASKGEERELEASTDMKPNRKHTVACRVRQLGPHVFRVAPEKPLPPGEYGFVAVSEGGAGLDRLWDFGVDGGAADASR